MRDVSGVLFCTLMSGAMIGQNLKWFLTNNVSHHNEETNWRFLCKNFRSI